MFIILFELFPKDKELVHKKQEYFHLCLNQSTCKIASFLNGIFQVDSSALTPNNAKHGMLFSFVAP